MRKKHELLGYTSMWLVAVLVLIALLAQSVGDARIVNYSGIVRGADVYKRQTGGGRCGPHSSAYSGGGCGESCTMGFPPLGSRSPPA